jgi:hypothetical protein
MFSPGEIPPYAATWQSTEHASSYPVAQLRDASWVSVRRHLRNSNAALHYMPRHTAHIIKFLPMQT